MNAIRPMTKSEIALMYLPTLTPHACVNRLVAWINECPQCKRELEESGYRKNQHYLTKEQVEIVFNWLGNP